MRERLARVVAALAVACLVALSVVFAEGQNSAQTTEPGGGEGLAMQEDPTRGAPPADTAHARALFTELGCAGCHAVGGVGNPRNPLDGVGSRRSPASIRAWTIGEGTVADSLSPAAMRVKRTYVDVPEADLEALIRWLEGLRNGG